MLVVYCSRSEHGPTTATRTRADRSRHEYECDVEKSCVAASTPIPFTCVFKVVRQTFSPPSHKVASPPLRFLSFDSTLPHQPRDRILVHQYNLGFRFEDQQIPDALLFSPHLILPKKKSEYEKGKTDYARESHPNVLLDFSRSCRPKSSKT